MYVELQSREVRPRKVRVCGWCAERIERGELCHYRSYIFEDGPQSDWTHLGCWEAIQDAEKEILQEGWMPGDFKRGSTEYT